MAKNDVSGAQHSHCDLSINPWSTFVTGHCGHVPCSEAELSAFPQNAGRFGRSRFVLWKGYWCQLQQKIRRYRFKYSFVVCLECSDVHWFFVFPVGHVWSYEIIYLENHPIFHWSTQYKQAIATIETCQHSKNSSTKNHHLRWMLFWSMWNKVEGTFNMCTPVCGVMPLPGSRTLS